ncbi:MAG: D-alanine--D-alanine ligase [Rickettsiales bacterium]|nr:D-alanine--D-alanine ligase [Rickettsiales bacterium]
MKVGVVYGGMSPEASISVKTKDSVVAALKRLGIKYEEIELNSDIVKNIEKLSINIVFNACHGLHGEDGRLPGMLDILKIPYTHSGSFASYIAMDKYSSYQLASSLNIKVADYEFVWDFKSLSDKAKKIMKEPFIIKPNMGGSSIGVYVFEDPDSFVVDEKYLMHGGVVVQKFVKGHEVNVAIVNNKSVGVVQVDYKSNFFDYDAKYSSSDTIYRTNSDISSQEKKLISEAAEKFHNFIGANNIARTEFIVNKGDYYFLETNTHPGLTDRSLIPLAARDNQIDFDDIVKSLLDSAKYYE